jgi:hypothetical protein
VHIFQDVSQWMYFNTHMNVNIIRDSSTSGSYITSLCMMFSTADSVDSRSQLNLTTVHNRDSFSYLIRVLCSPGNPPGSDWLSPVTPPGPWAIKVRHAAPTTQSHIALYIFEDAYGI